MEWNDLFKIKNEKYEQEKDNEQKGHKVTSDLYTYAVHNLDDYSKEANILIFPREVDPYRDNIFEESPMHIYGPEIFDCSDVYLVESRKTGDIFEIWNYVQNNNQHFLIYNKKVLKKFYLPDTWYKYSKKEKIEYYQNVVENYESHN